MDQCGTFLYNNKSRNKKIQNIMQGQTRRNLPDTAQLEKILRLELTHNQAVVLSSACSLPATGFDFFFLPDFLSASESIY